MNPKAFVVAVVAAAATAMIVNRVADHIYVRWLGRHRSAPVNCTRRPWAETDFPFDAEAFTSMSGGL